MTSLSALSRHFSSSFSSLSLSSALLRSKSTLNPVPKHNSRKSNNCEAYSKYKSGPRSVFPALVLPSGILKQTGQVVALIEGIEHIGRVQAVTPHDSSESGGDGFSLVIADAAPILTDCTLGDSIAINGVCLTVTQFDKDTFKVGLSPETLNRSSLGSLKVGDGVNLERAMGAQSRFGGHAVQGHVDATVSIVSLTPDGNSLRLLFHVSPPSTPDEEDILAYIIPKGYITLDGASLTITFLSDIERTFGVMLIAHTQSKITLAQKKVGDRVNVEVDMIGKYVQRSVLAALGSVGGTGSTSPIQSAIQNMVERALQRSH